MEPRNFAYLEALGHPFVVVNREGAIVFATSKALELLDYKLEQVVGRPVEIFAPSDVRARHTLRREEFARAPSERPMSLRVLYAQRRDGVKIRVNVGLTPVDEGDFVIASIAKADEAQPDEVMRRVADAASVVRDPEAYLASQIVEICAAQERLKESSIVQNAGLVSEDRLRRVIKDAFHEEIAEFGIDLSSPAARAEFTMNLQLFVAIASGARRAASYLGWTIILLALGLVAYFVSLKARLMSP